MKQYFSGELNFVFRADYKPQNTILHATSVMDPETSFRKRLVTLQSKNLIQSTQLANLDPKVVVRRCVKVGLPVEYR